jgi:hypothetical protein
MPKKTKAIPDDRAEWSFGDALYWHFFIHGTRPEGSPSDLTGATWEPKRAAEAVGVTIRAFWNWIDDRHFPYDTSAIERALFGASKLYDDAREELRRLLLQARERHRTPGDKQSVRSLPAAITGQAVTVHTTPFDEGEVDGPLTTEDLRAIAPSSPENFGKTGGNPPESSAVTLGSVFGSGDDRARDQGGAQRAEPPDSKAPRGKSKAVTAIIAGLALLFCGYAAKRYVDFQKEISASTETKQTPDRGSGTVDTGGKRPQGPTAEEQRAAEAKRREDERLAKLEKTALDAAKEERAKKEAKARELNIKLKALQQSEANDLCKQQLQGLSVPGFTLKCDTLIPFGKLLAKAGVSQTASSLGDCASRCRRESDCVAFSFDGGAHTGSASCYLTGSIPSQNAAPNWISGIRQ